MVKFVLDGVGTLCGRVFQSGPANENQVTLLYQQMKITSDTFFDIFPFMIVFNRGMRVRNVGLALLRYAYPCPPIATPSSHSIASHMIGKKINQYFVLLRPFIRFRWEDVRMEYCIFVSNTYLDHDTFE